MNKKFLLSIPALAVSTAFLIGGTAYASSSINNFSITDPTIFVKNWGDRIAEQAGILGISVEDMKNYWANGKSLQDIAQEKGISTQDLRAKIQAARDQQIKQMLQSLVSSGQITQAQADARLKFIQDGRTKQGTGIKGFGHRGRGFGGSLF